MTNLHITNFVNAIVSKMSTLINSHDSDSSAHSSLFAGKSDTGHTHTKSEVTDFPSSMTPTSHRATGTTYGVGNGSYYGHCRCVNNLTKSSHTDGYALSAYQGYVLKGEVDAKIATSNISTSISSSSTDAQVASAKAVYDHVDNLIGDIEEYI